MQLAGQPALASGAALPVLVCIKLLCVQLKPCVAAAQPQMQRLIVLFQAQEGAGGVFCLGGECICLLASWLRDAMTVGAISRRAAVQS